MARLSDLEGASLLNGQDTKPDSLDDERCSEDTVVLEPDVGRTAHTKSRSIRYKATLYLISKVFIIFLAVSGLASLTNHIILSIGPKPSGSCYCGNSVADALARGCKFDPIAPAWLPDHCRDDHLIEEWNRSGPGPDGSWTYYADIDGNTTLTLDELGRLADLPDPSFYTTHEWHLVHCVFYWRKMRIASRSENLTIETKYDNEEYITWCLGAFKDRAPLDEIHSHVRIVLDSTELIL